MREVGSRALPFDTFLDVLRSRGHPIGLDSYISLGKLLDRWEGTSSDNLSDAVSSLLGTNEEEVRRIRALFCEIYFPKRVPALPPEPPAEAVTPTLPEARRFFPVALMAFVVVSLGYGYFRLQLLELDLPIPVSPPPALVDEAPSNPRSTDAVVPAPDPPGLPAPPSDLEPGTALLLGLATFCVLLSVSWTLTSRAVHQSWLRNAWRAMKRTLPGPYDFELEPGAGNMRMPRDVMSDIGTTLGRMFTSERQSARLDLKESVRSTTKNGQLIRLVYKPLRTPKAILVLEDASASMQIWQDKIEGFLHHLRREGIAVERWFFDGDLRYVSERRYGASIPLDRWAVTRSDAPLLILSSGEGLTSLVGLPDRFWMSSLRSFDRRTWLHPVTDVRLWHRELKDVPVNVWPMSSEGLARAAHDLAGRQEQETVRVSNLRERSVRPDDVRRMKQLAAMTPHPSVRLLELLRQRFASDVPDAVHAWLFRESGYDGTRVLELSQEERERESNTLRVEHPRLEAAVRDELLRILSRSEPSGGSTAHLRWQLEVAVQQLSRATLTGDEASDAVATLDKLSRGPLWEEVTAALGNLPRTPAVTTALRRSRGLVSGTVQSPPPDNGTLERFVTRPRLRPSIGDVSRSALGSILLFSLLAGAGVIPARRLSHVPNAYELTRVARTTPRLGPDLLVRSRSEAEPRTVDLRRNGEIYRSGIRLLDAVTRISLSEEDAGNYYQISALLPDGNLALSNPVWVPAGDVRVLVVNALPWARVTISRDQRVIGEFVTPFRIALPFGDYLFDFARGDESIEHAVNVSEGLDPRVLFRFPGFSPDDAASTSSPQ